MRQTTMLLFITLLSGALHSCAALPALRQGPASAGDRAADYQNARALFSTVDRADNAYQQGQWQTAAQLYESVLQDLPDDPWLWFRLGNSLTQNGDYSGAIEAFETSLQHDAQQSRPWFNLSTVHLLGAQVASLKAWQAMEPGDPSRQSAQKRLDTLTELLR